MKMILKFRSIISIILCASMLSFMQPISASNQDQKQHQSYYEWTKNGIKKGAQWTWNHKVEIACAAVVIGVALYFGSQYVNNQGTGADSTGNTQAIIQYQENNSSVVLEASTSQIQEEMATIHAIIQLIETTPHLDAITPVYLLFNTPELITTPLHELFTNYKITCQALQILLSQGREINSQNIILVSDAAIENVASIPAEQMRQEFEQFNTVFQAKQARNNTLLQIPTAAAAAPAV